MRLEITNIDEKALPQSEQSEIYKVLREIRELQKQKKAQAEKTDSDQVMDDADIESKLVAAIKKLVDSSLWKGPKIQLNHLADIFNAIGERLEKWQDAKSRDELILWLSALNMMISKCQVDQNSKVENQDLVDIVQKSEDVIIIALAAEVLATFPSKSQIKLGSRVELFSLGSNLFRSSQNHFSLADYGTGTNKQGESLKNSDLIFDYEVDPVGLNDRVQAKTVVISRQDIVSNPKSAADLSKEIAEQHGKGSDENFKLALEVKIILCRYIVDEKTTKEAFLLRINSILLTSSIKRLEQNTQLFSYLKENFVNDCIEIITSWSDVELMIRTMHLFYKLSQRDQIGLLNVDQFLKVSRGEDQTEEQEGDPLIVELLSDIALRGETSTEEEQSRPTTKLINIEVATNSDFQMALLNILLLVIKQTQQINNRTNQSQIELMSNVVERLIRIVEQLPNKDGQYPFSIKVQQMTSSFLRTMVRSRQEESLNIVQRFEKRIIFEIDNLEAKFTYKSADGVITQVEQKDRQSILRTFFMMLSDLVQRDVNNSGISRRILESQILKKVVEVCNINTEEKGPLVEEFIVKAIVLAGMICYESPTNVPTLIKNGVIPAIFKSLEARLPNSPDLLNGCLQASYYFVLHQEGHDLFKTTTILERLFESTMDEKLCKWSNYQEISIIGQYLCSFYDKSPDFKETTKLVLQRLLVKLYTIASQIVTKYYEVTRQSQLTQQERQQAIAKLKEDPLLEQATGGSLLILSLSVLQTDRVNQSRHTTDIITEEIFKQLLENYEMFAIAEITSINSNITKTIKFLSEQQNVQTYVKVFVDHIKASIEGLSNLLGGKLEKLQNLDIIRQNGDAPMIELNQFRLTDMKNVLSRTEQFHAQIRIIEQYVKTFLQVPSATKQIIISTFEFGPEIRTLFYFQKTLNRERAKVFSEAINKLSENQEDESLKPFKDVLFEAQPKGEQVNQRAAKNLKIQEFVDTYIDTQGLQIKKDLQMFDLIHKIASYSFINNRSARGHRQEVQKKNCQQIGKFIYKMTKVLKNTKNSKISLQSNDKQLLHYLYQTQTTLAEINNCINKRQMDGLSFYQFYKSGGLTNLIESFHWLAKVLQVKNDEWQRIFSYLFEDSCYKIKEILLGIIQMNKIDNTQSSFLDINMTNEFDSPKHFFSNVFSNLCTNLLLNTSEDQNPLVMTYKENFSYLQEVIIQLLVLASQSFTHCQYIRESQKPDQRGRQRNQPDPAVVQSLVEMGFTREQASAALLQYGTLELAADHLLQNMIAPSDNFQNAVDEMGRISSDESDDQNLGIDVVNYENAFFDRAEKMQKVTIDAFKDNVHKVQLKSFDWILEAQSQDKVSNQKAKDLMYSSLIQEKEHEQQKSMFKKLADVLKRSIALFQEKVIKQLGEEQSSLADNDEPMEESKINSEASEQQIATKLYQDLQLLQKVVLREKAYSKESVRQDVYNECVKLLQKLLANIHADKFIEWVEKDKVNNQAIQTIIFELLLLDLTMIQFVSLDILAAQNDLQSKKVDAKLQNEAALQREKKNKEYRSRVSPIHTFDISLKILNTAIENQQKEAKFQFQKPIIILSIVLLLKGVTDESIQNDKKMELISQAFQILSKIKVNDGIDIKLVTSFALFSFQDPTVNLQTYEKLIQKVLTLKFEDQSEQLKKDKKPVPEEENSLSGVPYSQFLSYFKVLTNRDKSIFQKAMSNVCEVKGTKKEGKVVPESAIIRLKSSNLQEISKQQSKDRPLLKQLIKTIDIQGDTQFKKQAKQSKTAIQAQSTEDIQKTLNVLLSNLYDSINFEQQSITQYFELQAQKLPYIVSGEVTQTPIPEVFKNLELLASLSIAYPLASLTILQHQFPNKKSFVQWFLQEFLVCYQLQKKQQLQPKEEGSQIDQFEVSYDFKADLSKLDSSVSKILNLITGYNHLFNFNEIVIKFELRQKFVIESLQTLQKTIKSKKSSFPLKQRATVASCLIVIDSLINYEAATANKIVVASLENYYNSIRALIVRDSSASQSTPPSFIKIANELITDTVDVTSKLNSDIVRKTISIFKVLSDFINEQKKKIKAKERLKRPATGEANGSSILSEVQEEQKDNVVMLSESVDDQSHEEENDYAQQMNQPIGAEADHDFDDSEDDQDQEAEDEEAEEEEEGDEEDDENVQIEPYNQDEEDEDDDEDIDQFDYRIEGDADIQDDVDSDDEDVLIDDGFGGDRRAQQLDIVAINNRDVLNALQAQQNRRLVFQDNRGGVRPGDWSQEEQEVQRLLINMRGMLSNRQQPLGGNALIEDVVRQGRNPQAEAVGSKNLIEQMFENLNTISEQEIIELVLRQRQKMETDAQVKTISQHVEMIIPAQPQLARREVLQPFIDMNLGRIMFGNVNEVVQDIQHNLGEVQQLLQQHQNVLDPLYGRPWQLVGNQGLPPGGADLGQALAVPSGQIAGSELGVFSRLIRNSQQSAQENINDQLLNNAEISIIEVEESKEQANNTAVLQNQEGGVNRAELLTMLGGRQNEGAQPPNQFQAPLFGSDSLQLDQAPFEFSLNDQMFQSLSNSLLLGQGQNPPAPNQQLLIQAPSSEQPIPQLVEAPSQPVEQQQPSVVQNEGSDQVMEEVQSQNPPEQQQQDQQQQQEQSQQSEQPVAQDNVPEQVSANQNQVEEVKNEVMEESKESSQQEEAKPAEEAADSGKTFGYDNELLLANDIDPAILHELPEDVRAELLSSIDLQVQQQNSQQQQNNQEQQPVQQQPNANANAANAEEQKDNQQQQQPAANSSQQQNSSTANYAQLASELGIDPTFLESIPEEFRRELIDNELRQRNPVQAQQPHREAEQMDLASFIATVTDPNLRAEILSGLDEASLASLPPNLMAEARRIHDQVRSSQYERILMRQMMEGGAGHGHAHAHQIGRGGRGGYRREADGHRAEEQRLGGRNFFRMGEDYNQQRNPGAEQTLEYIVNKRHRDLAEEQDNDDSISSLQTQLASDEKLIEALLVVLCGNDSTECTLIPLLDSLIKIQNSNGQLAIRNKIINAITFLLRYIALNEEEALKVLLPNVNVNKSRASLLLIGTLRIMIRNNKKLIQHILKGLISKEDYFKQQGNHTLKKQQKAVLLLKTAYLSQPSLAEIFSLVKTPIFKSDKVLMRNLSILIHQILKQFDVVIEDLGAQSQQISKESVESLAEILSLEIIDFNLMSALGEFLFQISRKKRQNFDLISDYCENRSNKLLDKLNDKLEGIGFKYENLKIRLSPNRSVSQSELAYSQHDKDKEEEKVGDMQIDTSAVQTQVKQLKLSDEEEKSLKQALKVTEDSEILLRIFKLFNLFYEKFSTQEVEHISIEETQEAPQKSEVVARIKKQYDSPQIHQFIQLLNDVLRIIQNANIDIQESISNLIFCVFGIFFPDVAESQKVEEVKDQGEDAANKKFDVTMIPIGESLAKSHGEKFVLFKKFIEVTPRLQELSNFCQRNKKVINKLIKVKSNLLLNEMDFLIKYMPNLLDFENKRAHFKLELAKLKKNQYYEQINLVIRRDDIFMDSYAQLNIRSAAEMKGKLHIQFQGERGQDAGGLTRDFYIELSREMFNANYSLFILSSNGSAYYPNPRSYVEKDHLRYFKFIGKVIGKALLDECLLECYFVKSLYKVMTGEALNFQDLEDFDNEFFNNMKWCLEHDVEPLMASFSIEQDFFGKTEEIELKEGGKKIPVTNENKNEYVEKLTYFKLYKNIQKQIDAFLDGFYELIPKDLVSMFNYKELELLISGLPNFDIDDLKANTEYQGYQANSPQVQWLWEILESFENSERAEFLQFVTGSSKVPVEGFRGLMGMRGPQRFTIAKIKTDDPLRLPSGHTCFNQIDIPEYPSKEIMHERVMVAIKETKGFGFA